MLSCLSTSKCAKAYEELCSLIPGGVNSGARAFVGLERIPLIIDYAKDDYIVDLDGKQYTDFCMSWGALIMGHAHEDIVKAVGNQIAKGSSYGITHNSEKELAQILVDIVPHLEKVRFLLVPTCTSFCYRIRPLLEQFTHLPRSHCCRHPEELALLQQRPSVQH